MNIPNHLTSLAADINAALTRDEKNRDDWVAIKLDLCRLFADARTKFADNVSFGQWRLKEIGNTVNDKDCTAYVAMGADLARARVVLEKTTRSSIQHIHANEFPDRSAHVSGTAKAQKPLPLNKVQTYATMQAAAAHGATIDQLAIRHNVSEEHVKEVLGLKLPPSDDELAAQPVSASAQKILDAHKRRLEKDFEGRVLAEVIKRIEEAEARLRKRWDERMGALEKAWNRRGKVFTKAEFGTILKVLHPDGKHASEDARNEAFRVFNARKIKLLDENDFPVVRDVQQIRADMAAARAKVRAENSARAQRAAATRKARQQEAQP